MSSTSQCLLCQANPSGVWAGEGRRGMCRCHCQSLRMLFSGYEWAVSLEPGGMYSLHVWQCCFRCLLQIPAGPLPAGISLLLHASSEIPRCIFAVVLQAHPFCFFAPSVSHSVCVSGLKNEGSSYSKCRLDEKEFFCGEGQMVAQEKYRDNVSQHERLVSAQLQP